MNRADPGSEQPTLTHQQALDLGLRHHTAGDLSKAEDIYQQILQTDPNHPVALHLLGVVAHQKGKNDTAVDLISKAVAIKSNYAEAHNNLGLSFQGLGKLNEAVASYYKALDIKPDYAEANYNLGNAFEELGRLDKAIASYHKVITIKPDYVEAHYNLGSAFQVLGRHDEAIASYHKALDIKPDYAEAHNNIGLMLQTLGKVDEAVASCQIALSIKPDYAEAHSNLGSALKNLGKLDEAIASYRKALSIKSDFAEAHNNLGAALHELSRLDEASIHYRKSLSINPEFAEAHSNLGMTFQIQGNVDEAVKQMDIALSYKPEKAGWRIRRALFLPIIPFSQDDIQYHRGTFSKAVAALIKENLTVSDPVVDVGITNFYLAYHDRNNRNLMQNIAELHLGVCPKLAYEAKHCQSRQKANKDVIRVGFLSSYFRDHTIGKLTHGIIQYLSRDLFEVIVFRPPGKKDHMSEIIDQAADEVVSLHKKLERDWEVIEEEELDILFYPDIGMDPYTYFLSFARLAPVQVVSWGHPDTTGIPNIDYFISSELLEISDASIHYTEQLIQPPYLSTYYFRPEVPEKPLIRDDFGLPDDGNLYVCPQSLFKFHPGFDDILGELLRSDPDGYLILIDDHTGGYWKRLLYERFKRAFPDVIEQVIFVPHMPHEKYLGLLILADALIDIPTFSGGNSSLEALAMGAPIITWPNEFLRGRFTAALYKQMGLSDLIATDKESYLTLSLRLAQDADFKRQMQDDIKANAYKLYERHEVVREMESFFIAAHEAWKTGKTLTNPTIPK